jgi:hypothetical protein
MQPYIVLATVALVLIGMGWFASHLDRRHKDDEGKK